VTSILALDLASTSGWAYGEPGSVPTHGVIRFAAVGSSHEAIFANAANWMREMCMRPIDTICWEAPLPTSFKPGYTNIETTTILFGLPAVIGAVAYNVGIYDIRKAGARDVRRHFLGCNPQRKTAKKMVIRQCKKLGWHVTDDNEADALATWHYMCSLIEPKLAMMPTPLFGRAS
jgi:hypothetical protein